MIFFYVYAVYEYLTFLNVVVAADKREYGRLARARSSHKSDRVVRPHLKGHALKHPFVFDVGKPNVAKFDVSLHFAEFDRSLFVDDVRLKIHDGKYLFSRRECRLKPIELLGKALNGIEEFRYVHIESDYGLARERLPEEGHIVYVSLSPEEEQT